MSKARNLSLLSTVEAGATADQTKADIDALGINRGRKNLIINGGMDVWQRGTSSTASSYQSDRWSTDTAGSHGRSTDAPTGFAYSLKINPSSGNAVIRQAIELPAAGVGGVFRAGQQFTVSFWLKSSVGGEGINLFIASATGVSGGTTQHLSLTSFATTTTGWVKYTYTYTQAASVGASDTCYNIVPYVVSAAGDTYFTGVQLELGSVATDFEHRSYGEELALCQRYYQRFGAPDDAQVLPFAGMCVSSSVVYFVGQTYVPMRVQPTGSSVNPSNFRVRNASNSGIPTISSLGVSAYSNTLFIATAENASGLTAGHASHLFNYNGSNYGYIQLDAEL